MSWGNVVNLSGLQVTNPSKIFAETIFQKNRIFLNDLTTLIGAGLPVPLPLVGFDYMPMDRVELLKYSYSEYPYLNREAITNTYIKQPLRFSVLGIKPITRLNNLFVSFALNISIMQLLELYCDMGGTFLVITPWNVITPCVCESIEGVQVCEGDIGGQGFLFTFKRPNIYEDTTSSQSAFIKAISAGGAV